MCIVTTQVVKADGDVVGNHVQKVSELSRFEAFQTDVALPCSFELSPLFWH